MKITGFVRLGGKLVISAQGGCFITDLEHNTNSVLAGHAITSDILINQYGAKPGTKWYVQWGTWTFPDNEDVRVFATDRDEMKFWVNGMQYDYDFYDASSFAQYVKGNNFATISSVNHGSVTTDPDSGMPIFSDPILMLAYTAGAYKPLLEVSYGDGPRHSAVEMFFNGAWKNGAPVDGACKPLLPADYLPKEILIPGGVTFDERGGMGSTGESASTVTTRGAGPSNSITYPGFVSTMSGLTRDTLMTDLGYVDGQEIKFSVRWDASNPNYDSDTGPLKEISVTVYANYTTIGHVMYDLRYTWAGLHAGLSPDGRFIIYNFNQNVTSANAFDFPADSNLAPMFGSFAPALVPVKFWASVSSTNLFTLSTPLAQFAPKGTFEVGVENPQGIPGFVPRTVGFIGESEMAPPGATMLTTVGDLINAINAIDGGSYAYAYLENGRLIVSIVNVFGHDYDSFEGNATMVVVGRYVGDTAFREAAELMYGASDFRYNTGYLYNDQPVSFNNTASLIRQQIFTGDAPARQSYPVVPTVSTVVGDRQHTRDTDVSTLYPAGYILIRRDTDGWQYALSNMEVGGGNTIGDLLNYMNDATMTLRFVDSEGTHAADGGYLRMTSGRDDAGVGIMWFNPATRDFGVARRLFTTDGVDGSAPTNFAGTL